MAEGEGSQDQDQAQAQAQAQARNQTQNHSENETQKPGRGRSRGGQRRGRGGRGCGGTGNGASRGSQNAPVAQDAPTAAPAVPAAAPAPAPAQSEPAAETTGNQRNRRNRQGQRGQRGQRGGRGGLRGTGNQVMTRAGPHRQFGGHLTQAADDSSSVAESEALLSLSADAPEFVPGQSVTARSAPSAQARARPKRERKPRQEVPKSTAPELWKRIHEDINNYNYDCAVCMDSVNRDKPVWDCSICYTVLHLSCVKAWYKSAKKPDESLGGAMTWRCPGCNSILAEEPGNYYCWCGKEREPSSVGSVLPPHSCGQTCSKPRSTCPHPCSLQCHAGPCPPCDIVAPPEYCYCGKHTVTKLCRETDYENGWSCQEPCADLLPCGDHVCPQSCHPGICGDCRVPVEVKCFCGDVHKEVPCFRREDSRESYDLDKKAWFAGEFFCGKLCEREYDCGIHKCAERCHPQDESPAHCPFAPDVVLACPCGKTPLAELMVEPRTSCSDAIPHCEKQCDKLLACGHLCDAKCHIGDCPTCEQMMEVDCRCGRITEQTVCHQGEVSQPWCFKVCQANKSCGRHRCGQHCCPGDKRALARGASQKKNRSETPPVEAEHICLQTCGRPLKCGSHNCEARCHRGPCPSCPEAIFHEISCNCGQTVLQPPLPCGTHPPACTAQCRRGRPCGHPQTDHRCHEDDAPCPPCAYLVEKECACGKKTLPHVPCHLQEPHCGQVCGQKLKCGSHTCKKLCHRPGECKDAEGGCEQVCGKRKLLCEHTCQDICHGRTPCSESAPCKAKLVKTCPCGHYKKEIKCNASSANPEPSRPEMKCDEECARLDRNRRLAAALNINPAAHTNDHVPYSDMTLKLYKDDTKWGDDQERQFRVFAKSPDEIRIRYKPMRSSQRQFLHCLAEDFGLSSRSEDEEPYKHVVVFKTSKFVAAPEKTLAVCVKIRAEQATEAAVAAAAERVPTTPPIETEPWNGFLFTAHRFGLTMEEIEAAVRSDLDTLPSFTFTTEFLPYDEVLVKASASYSAFLSAPMDQVLSNLKPRLEQSVRKHNIAANVLLCHFNAEKNEVTRRENLKKAGTGGWSAVAGRAATKKPTTLVEDAPAGGRKLLGLKKKKPAAEQKSWSTLDGDVEC